MKLYPVLTEKSLNQVKEGKYTFKIEVGLTKAEIKRLIEDTFSVHVTSIRTINKKALVKRNLKGFNTRVKPEKKAIVSLKKDEKIDLFEDEGKKKK